MKIDMMAAWPHNGDSGERLIELSVSLLGAPLPLLYIFEWVYSGLEPLSGNLQHTNESMEREM